MRIADSIQSDRSWKGHGSAAQDGIVAQSADDYLSFWERQDAWIEAKSLAVIAPAVIGRTEKLAHVNQSGLRLLAADDQELLVEAERLAEINRRRIFVHPRDRDASSIRRRLRRTVSRAALHSAALLGLIGGPKRSGRPSYADDWTVRRFHDLQAAKRKFLCEHVAVRVGGDPIPMTTIAKGAAASRRAMWYALIMGMRGIARKDRLVPVFVTLTLPPAWHLNPQYGQPGDPKHSPSDGAREIGRRWHNALCQFRERGGDVFGVRVAEPHADATVHLHVVLWLSADQLSSFCECLGHHFPATTPAEKSFRQSGDYSEGPALVVRRWVEREGDDPRGSADAASYALSYILDVLEADAPEDSGEDASGEGAQTDAAGRAVMDAARPAAWARHMGIRRISVVGLAPGTIGKWRAIYRAMKSADRTGLLIKDPRARSVAHAMRRGHWSSALRLLGAMQNKKRQRFKALREPRKDRWGDAVSATVAYYNAKTGEISVDLALGEWTIEKAGKSNPLSVATLSDVVSYPRQSPVPRPPREFSG